ncbi:ECF transporter S component [Caloramator sp. mosi_1]|uniref:ECF transporter S component n=1 Tax=Caloramator sp. mosi_1 TaxID=3023090 RepID=UPI00235DE90A|nr:ECF transporter S component [Caloramator sp. mosi_1]WDC83893.1 ECF transporter S component [Caloramator sp. mosi_1]
MNKNQKVSKIVTLAMAIALVTVCTMVIRIPSIKGYTNFGDIMIFVVAAVFGRKYGFIAGGLGSMLADLLGGYFIYAPATLIIKGIEGFIFAIVYEKLNQETTIATLIAGLIAATEMMLGYFAFNYYMNGYASAIGSLIPGDLTQGLVSSIVAVPIVIAIKKTKFKLINQE